MKKIALVNAHVISPGVDLADAVVVVEGANVKSVSRAKPPKGAEIVDVKGAYVVPGFIDVLEA